MGPMLSDLGAENAIRICVQPDIGEFSQLHVLQVVLENVAHESTHAKDRKW